MFVAVTKQGGRNYYSIVEKAKKPDGTGYKTRVILSIGREEKFQEFLAYLARKLPAESRIQMWAEILKAEGFRLRKREDV